MPVTGKVEIEKRIRIVQDWLIQDYPNADIIQQCINKGWVTSKRQAERYIKQGLERWAEEEDKKLSLKRASRTQSLKKMLRSIDPKAASTPSGIRALLAVHDRIIALEGIKPTRQMIEAEIAKDQGKQADPLSPTSNMLKIEIINAPDAEDSDT